MAESMSDLTTQIETQAEKTQATSADGVSVSRRSLTDLIEADKHLRATEATKPANISATIRGMMLKIVPPGGH